MHPAPDAPAILVADVGGTNARFAVMRGGRPVTAPKRLTNRDHARFEDAAAAYLASVSAPRLDAVCAAFAGPVQGGRARLTNHDWAVEEADMAAALGAGRGLVLNDLAAMGHACALLDETGAPVLLRAVGAAPGGNGQALAAGFGTGMNLCLTAPAPGRGGGRVALAAEYGHASLPTAVAAHLPGGRAPRAASTVEHWFSGRGLTRLDAALHGGEGRDGAAVAAAAAEGEAKALATCRCFAAMAGSLCLDLSLQFMPEAGLFLAGSVARGPLGAPGAAACFAAARGAHPDPRFAALAARIPVRLIADDLAALAGCAAAAEAALAAG